MSLAGIMNRKSPYAFGSHVHLHQDRKLLLTRGRVVGKEQETNALSDYHRHLLRALSIVTLHLVAGAA